MSRPERGAYGNKRGKELQVRKRRNREADPRYQSAMQEVNAQQAELEALMAEQAANPAVGVVDGALHSARLKEQQRAVARAEREATKIAEQLPADTECTAEDEPIIVPKSMKMDLRKLPQRGDGHFSSLKRPLASCLKRAITLLTFLSSPAWVTKT